MDAVLEEKMEVKPGFGLADIPDAVLGFFGVRTESELPFRTISENGPFSIRFYEAHTEMICERSGDRPRAVDAAFEPLFGYLKGQNADRRLFSMTTPVLAHPVSGTAWSVGFYMESKPQDLPAPRSPDLHIREVPGQTFAVLKLCGNPTDPRVRSMTERLTSILSQMKLEAIGPAHVAQFDQPFALPFLKRNEVLIPIRR